MTQKLVLRGDLLSSIDIHTLSWSALDMWRHEWERWHDLAIAVLYAGPLGDGTFRHPEVSELDAISGHVEMELAYGEQRQRVIARDDDRWVVIEWLNAAPNPNTYQVAQWLEDDSPKDRALALVDLTATLWMAAQSMEHAAIRSMALLGIEEATWRLGVASELAAALDLWERGAAVREALRQRDAQQPAAKAPCDEDVPF